MDTLIKNINAIRKYSPFLANSLEKKESNNIRHEIYTNFNDKIVVKYQDYKKNMIHYTSYYDPEHQAKEMVSKVEFDTNRLLIICIGIGAGYQIDEVIKKKTKKSLVIVVEKDINLLKDILSRRDFSENIIKDNLYFCCGEELDSQIEFIVSAYTFSISKVSYVTFEVFDLDYSRYYRDVAKIIEDYKQRYLFCLGNDVDDTLLGIRNNFENIVQYIKSPGIEEIINSQKDRYINKPAIIVASGPSLDKNIHQLKDAMGKALILSCDGSYSSLLKHNIVPDSIGSVERIEYTYEAFYKNRNFNKEVVLTSPAVVKKGIVNKFIDPQRVLSIFKDEAYGRWFNKISGDKGCVTCGASVAHMLCGVAIKLGCNPIILVGQDLAYSIDGVSHTSEAEVKEVKDITNAEVYVEGINGEKLASTYIWKMFLDIYENIIKGNDKVRFIDATEGGAKLEGTEIMTLKDAINTYCNEDTEKLINVINKISISNEKVKKVLQSAVSMSKEEIETINKIIKKIDKAMKDNIYSKKHVKMGIKNQEILDKIYDSIEFVEEVILSDVGKSDTLTFLLQYPITVASHEINLINTDKYTFESLEANIDIQKNLLVSIDKYLKLCLKEFELGLDLLEKELQKY